MFKKALVLIPILISLCHSNTPLHYDDFCGGAEVTRAVVFKQISRDGHCVCFGVGTYTYHKSPPPPLCSLKPINFHVFESTCVHIPHRIKTLEKVSESADTKHPHVFAYFTQCNNEIHLRVKRDAAAADAAAPAAAAAAPAAAPAAPAAAAPAAAAAAPAGAGSMDEDFSSAGTEIGHEMMRNQMNQYIESVIAKLTGLQGEGSSASGGVGGGGRQKYPVIKLLDYTKQIMQKTCTVVNPDFFDLALNSFINLQLETYHIKEPYIGYSAFKRIEQAMNRCLKSAGPHIFVIGDRNSTMGAEVCDNHVPNTSSNKTVIFGGTEDEEVKNITIPPYASSEIESGKIAEPLIESVWKMLVSAHSYCYMYFSDYFNDHHTYTVALLPLFTNEIQEVWLNEVNGKKLGYDLTDPVKNKLYGGLLGDVIGVLKDVDYCVGASRAISPYPWFMNRPLRDSSNGWNKRKKRDVEDVPHVVKGKVVSGDGVLLHECKNGVEIRDVC